MFGHGFENGPTARFDPEHSERNWPFRGQKHELFEGGVRSFGIVHSPLLPPALQGASHDALVHITDWFPVSGAKSGLGRSFGPSSSSCLPAGAEHSLFALPRSRVVIDPLCVRVLCLFCCVSACVPDHRRPGPCEYQCQRQCQQRQEAHHVRPAAA